MLGEMTFQWSVDYRMLSVSDTMRSAIVASSITDLQSARVVHLGLTADKWLFFFREEIKIPLGVVFIKPLSNQMHV